MNKFQSIYDRCPICGAFWELAYRKVWGELRFDCNKCGFGMRGDQIVQQHRYNEIIEGKTKEERLEIAKRT